MILKAIKSFIDKDRYVSIKNASEILFARQMVALIAGIGFVLMSIANIKEDSKLMLISTLVGAGTMLLAFALSKGMKTNAPLFVSFTLTLAGILPIYVVRGGNEGFAALWLCVATYLCMYFVGFLYGFFINLYYTILLFLIFYFEVPYVNYSAYSSTFRLRFPILFLINFGFATFFVINCKAVQYDLLIEREKFKQLSITDLNTNTYNRNAFIDYLKKFPERNADFVTSVYIDANGLHELNNREGHMAGDVFLKAIADECKSKFPEDKVYRMGGDEFLIISLNKDYELTEKLMNEALSNLERQGYSISFGIESKKGELNLKEIVDESNRIMLENKAKYYANSGKDRRRNRN